MKILYIAHYFRNSNAATISTCEVIKTLESLGNNVVILTNDPKSTYQNEIHAEVFEILPRISENIAIKLLRCTLGYLFVFLSIIKLRKRYVFDAIFTQHHNFHFASLTGCIIAYLFRIPLVIKIHDVSPWESTFIRKIYNQGLMNAWNRMALRCADAILALTSEIKIILEKTFMVSNNRLYVLGNIVDSSKLNVTFQQRMNLRKKLNLDHNKVLLFLGETSRRGIELIIPILSILSHEHNVKLLIVGPSQNREGLEELSEILGIRRSIVFIGQINHEQVPAYISIADIGIGPLTASPLTVGACPRKVLEYMAFGKPVIAFQGTVSHDLLIDSYNGFCINHVEQLNLKILNLIKNRVLYRRMSENGKNHVQKYFSPIVSKKVITQVLNDIFHYKQDKF